MQRDHRVHPRRLDSAPRPISLLAPDDPFGGAAKSGTAEPPVRPPLVDVQEVVQALEPALPRRHRVPRRRGEAGAQLAEIEPQRPRRSQGADDGERNDRLAGPAREVVHVHGEPGREEDHLRRQRRQVVPGPLAEQREPQPREHARPLEPSPVQDVLTRRSQVDRVPWVACKAEGCVGLDRRRQVAGSAEEVRPRAVGPLLGPDPCCRRLEDLGREHPQELSEQEVLRVHRHVRLELALPPAGWVL